MSELTRNRGRPTFERVADIVQAVVQKVDDGYLAACPHPPLRCVDETLDGAIRALEDALRADRESEGERFYLVVSLYFGPFSVG